MGSSGPVNAEGDLGVIPFAHLLVYAMDRQLTGTVFLKEPNGVEHAVRFSRGCPVRVRPGDGGDLLGALLVEAGEIGKEALQGALRQGGLVGEALVAGGHLTPLALDHALEVQFKRRMVRLFALPPETTFLCLEGSGELADWGTDASLDPLALLWTGVREHGDASTMMEGTLARLGDAIPRIHPRAALERFCFTGEDREALEILQANPIPFPELVAFEALPEATLRRVLYVLLITRSIDTGKNLPPAGVDDPEPPKGVTAPVGVARVQLRAAVHRLGAAAPDLPGDGERAAISPTTRVKRKSLLGGPPVPAAIPAREGPEPVANEPASVREAAASEPASVREVAAAKDPASGREPVSAKEAPTSGPPQPRSKPARALFAIEDEDTGSSLVERTPPAPGPDYGERRKPSGLYSLQAQELVPVAPKVDVEIEVDVELPRPDEGA